jgi:hypothetical protein
METRRLRKLQQPSQVERLLDTVISRAKLVPDDSYPIRDPKALPAGLRRIALQSVKEGQVWACWTSGLKHWLFTAEMSLEASRERKKPVLRVNCYDDQGELKETASWMANPEGHWGRCSD